MSHNAGDDGSMTYPVIDNNGGALDVTPAVVAHNSDGDTVAITASWKASAATVPGATGSPVPTFRDLVVPLATVPLGIWTFELVMDGAEDLQLFTEVFI